MTYESDGVTFASKQVIYYDSYDQWGNVLIQRVDLFDIADNFLERKLITNTYSGSILMVQQSGAESIVDGAIAARRGNAITTTVERYMDSGMTLLVERQEMTTDRIDWRGNIVDQTIATYVTIGGVESLSTKTIINNVVSSIDNRGDAKTQMITTWTCPTGIESEGLLEVSYQVITNRDFDSQRRVENQKVL